MKREAINPDNLPRTTDLSQAVRVGDLIFCSGQIGIGPDGQMVPGGAREQMLQAFANLRLLLEKAGSGLQDVVKITAYLVDRADRDDWVEVRRQHFHGPYPASTLVVVRGLAQPSYLFELDATAVIGSAAS